MSFNTSLISEEQWWSPFPPTLFVEKLLCPKCGKFSTFRTQLLLNKTTYVGRTSPLFFWDQARVKRYITCPPSPLKFRSWIQDGGRGTHVTHFVQLYPQPLYTASQVRTTSRSWDKVVLTDLCLTLYIYNLLHTQLFLSLQYLDILHTVYIYHSLDAALINMHFKNALC